MTLIVEFLKFWFSFYFFHTLSFYMYTFCRALLLLMPRTISGIIVGSFQLLVCYALHY